MTFVVFFLLSHFIGVFAFPWQNEKKLRTLQLSYEKLSNFPFSYYTFNDRSNSNARHVLKQGFFFQVNQGNSRRVKLIVSVN